MTVFDRTFRVHSLWKCFIVAFLFVFLLSCVTPSFSVAEENEESDESMPEYAIEDESDDSSVEDRLNDFGSDNLVNVQQTPDNSFLYDIPVSDLCSADSSYQKTTVQTKGEAVGDPIKAEQNPGKYWITLNSISGEKEGSLSVLVDQSALNAIDTYGSYGKQGTIIRVKGIYHIACTSHEGIADIHADTVTAVDAGYSTKEDFEPKKLLPGLLMCVLGGLLALGYRMLAEGER